MFKRFKINRIRHNGVEIFAWVFLSVMAVAWLFPMFSAIIVSISSRESIRNNGYALIPESFSLEAYKLLFTSYGTAMYRSLVLTIATGLIQPIGSIFLTACMAYPMSQPDLKGKQFWKVFLIITMLFSAGLVPNYILRVTYLGLKNNILIFLLPGVGAWSVFMYRTFFMNIDKGLVESAKIDGATKMQILFKIMIPLIKPMVAISYFNSFLGRWNDITTNIYYATDKKLYTFQYVLQQTLKNYEALKGLIEKGWMLEGSLPDIPVDSTKYALAVLAAIPVIILFPYVQKFYAKGIMMGSIKG